MMGYEEENLGDGATLMLAMITLIEAMRFARMQLLVDTPLHLQIKLQAECVSLADAISEAEERRRRSLQ